MILITQNITLSRIEANYNRGLWSDDDVKEALCLIVGNGELTVSEANKNYDRLMRGEDK